MLHDPTFHRTHAVADRTASVAETIEKLAAQSLLSETAPAEGIKYLPPAQCSPTPSLMLLVWARNARAATGVPRS